MLIVQTILPYAAPAVAGLLLAGAALHDVALRTIPNAASIGLVVVGVALRLQYGGIGWSVLLAALVFAGAVFCWRRGWFGGGDVKLLAATVLVVPPLQVGSLLVLTAQCGGVLAVLYLILSRVVRRPVPGRQLGGLRRIVRAERWRICRGAPLPYAFAIAAGGITLLIKGL